MLLDCARSAYNTRIPQKYDVLISMGIVTAAFFSFTATYHPGGEPGTPGRNGRDASPAPAVVATRLVPRRADPPVNVERPATLPRPVRPAKRTPAPSPSRRATDPSPSRSARPQPTATGSATPEPTLPPSVTPSPTPPDNGQPSGSPEPSSTLTQRG